MLSPSSFLPKSDIKGPRAYFDFHLTTAHYAVDPQPVPFSSCSMGRIAA